MVIRASLACCGALLALAAVACERPRSGPTPAPAPALQPSISPNASILPAPLAPLASAPKPASPAAKTPPPAASIDTGRPDAGTPPPPASPLRAEQPLPTDSVSAKESAGVLMVAEWRWPDAPAPPRLAEVHAEGIAQARRLTSFKWLLAATEAGRLRILFDARAFPLPLGAELRARADRFGHVIVFPSGNEYRPVAPGSLRALFGDRRLDALPLVPGEVSPKGSTPPRLNLPARRVEVSSRMGTVSLDLGKIPEAGLGAMLLCRTLLELIAVDPSLAVCASGDLPLRAQFTWPSGGSVIFEIQEYTRRPELPVFELHCPPLGARFAASALPPQPSGVLLTRDEASAFRSRPIDLGPPQPGSPSEGLTARNATDGLLYLLLDGVPVAWVLPGQEPSLLGPPRGRYSLQWRSFLGDFIESPRSIELPARVSVGEPRGEPGSRDGGK